MRNDLENLEHLHNLLEHLRHLAMTAVSGSALILVVYYLTGSIDLALVIAALVIAVFFMDPLHIPSRVIQRLARALLSAWSYTTAFMAPCGSAAARHLRAMRWLIQVALASIGASTRKALRWLISLIQWLRAMYHYLRELIALPAEMAALRKEVADLRQQLSDHGGPR